MARKFLKRFFPDPVKVRQNPSLQFLGKLLQTPNLFHLNRHSVSLAVFWGIFIAFVYPLPGQMPLAALAALYLGCNLPICVALVWITNPITIPFFFYLAYRLGCWVLGMTPETFQVELTWAWAWQEMERLVPPFMLGSLLLGLGLGSLGYVGIRLLWRWTVAKQWRQRQRRRATEKILRG